MPVDMAWNSRSRSFAQIHANVEAVGVIGLRDPFDAPRDELVDFKKLAIAQLAQIGRVPVGRNHKVSVRIRKGVHDDERRRSAIQNQVLTIAFLSGEIDENASRRRIGRLNVRNSPRSPKPICHATNDTAI